MRLAIGLLLAAGLGAADRTVNPSNDGNALLRQCESFLSILNSGNNGRLDQAFDAGQCSGFMEGMLALALVLEGASRESGNGKHYCGPNVAAEMLGHDSSFGRVVLVTVLHLYANRAELHKHHKDKWALWALKEFYPCKE